MHTVLNSDVGRCFGLSAYEVRRAVDAFTDPACLSGKKITEAGVEAIAATLGTKPDELAAIKRDLGFAPPPFSDADKKNTAAGPTRLMVARLMPNPTWVQAFPEGAQRGDKPVEVRVGNNSVLRVGYWMEDCQPIGNGRFAWAGKKTVLRGRA